MSGIAPWQEVWWIAKPEDQKVLGPFTINTGEPGAMPKPYGILFGRTETFIDDLGAWVVCNGLGKRSVILAQCLHLTRDEAVDRMIQACESAVKTEETKMRLASERVAHARLRLDGARQLRAVLGGDDDA